MLAFGCCTEPAGDAVCDGSAGIVQQSSKRIAAQEEAEQRNPGAFCFAATADGVGHRPEVE